MSFTHRKFLSTLVPINPPPSLNDFHHAPPPGNHDVPMGSIFVIADIFIFWAFYFFYHYTIPFAWRCYLRMVRSRRSIPPLPYRSRDGFVGREHVPEAGSSAGLQQSAIDSIIGQKKYRKGETECCCCVCQFDFDEDESVRVLPNCGHVYHVPCIDPWLRFRGNCPLCRALIVGGDQETEHGGALFLDVTGGGGSDRNLDSAMSMQIDEDDSGDGEVELEVEIGEPVMRNRENLDSELTRRSSFSDCERSRLCTVFNKS